MKKIILFLFKTLFPYSNVPFLKSVETIPLKLMNYARSYRNFEHFIEIRLTSDFVNSIITKFSELYIVVLIVPKFLLFCIQLCQKFKVKFLLKIFIQTRAIIIKLKKKKKQFLSFFKF